MYRAMAGAEKDEKRAAIFAKLAENEERHAQRWARLIQSGGGAVPAHRPSARVRMLGIGLLASAFSYPVGWFLGVSV